MRSLVDAWTVSIHISNILIMRAAPEAVVVPLPEVGEDGVEAILCLYASKIKPSAIMHFNIWKLRENEGDGSRGEIITYR